MKIFLSTIILLVAGTFNAQAQHELDGKEFLIKLKLVEGKRSAGLLWEEDVITFRADHLKSRFMSQREQFPPAPCERKVEDASGDKIITFTASHRNTGVSDIKWEGTVRGNKIEGTAVWTNMQGPRTYSFEGTRRGKK